MSRSLRKSCQFFTAQHTTDSSSVNHQGNSRRYRRSHGAHSRWCAQQHSARRADEVGRVTWPESDPRFEGKLRNREQNCNRRERCETVPWFNRSDHFSAAEHSWSESTIEFSRTRRDRWEFDCSHSAILAFEVTSRNREAAEQQYSSGDHRACSQSRLAVAAACRLQSVRNSRSLHRFLFHRAVPSVDRRRGRTCRRDSDAAGSLSESSDQTTENV